MNDDIMLVIGGDGSVEKYDDSLDIIIHCASEKEHKEVCEKLKKLFASMEE